MQRLPGLHSSNIMYNNLTGKDDTLEFEDILNSKYSVMRPAEKFRFSIIVYAQIFITLCKNLSQI